MDFDFDSVIERRGTDSFKWWGCEDRDILPLPVADMDFAAPPAVLEALHRRVDHGIFGYGRATRGVAEAVVGALDRDHGWRVDPAWIVWLPGVVPGLGVGCRMLAPAEAAVTFTPVYPPFLDDSVLAGRPQALVPLENRGGRWEIDFDLLAVSTPPNARLLMLCSPQNPTGTVVGRADLERLAAFALERGMTILSDEIHCDLVLDSGRPHTVTASLGPEIAALTITLMAPSKTYNLPGLGCAFAVIPDGALRRAFRAAAGEFVPWVNVMGFAACEAAYRDGGPWRAALLDYLRGNRDLVQAEVGSMPGLSMNPVEATYLAWIDCRPAGLADPAGAFLAAGVKLMDGARFGAPGFVRLNFACPRARLAEALRRMRSALSGHRAQPD
ncbi:MAG: PatB family C-S lyase [Verrucomicrobia bacterium]|nr:PatB family C-S lyase [Verrucomicrobiota bacterium]